MNTDDPNAYGASWYSATRVASPPRGRLTVELDVDVCVIGAGLAGLTAAREVARLGWSVVVLEAQGIAWSASGRNAGVVLPGFALSAKALVQRVGLDHAKVLWARSEAGAEYVRNAARDMAGVALSETGWLHVSKTDDPAAMASQAALLVGEFGAAVEPWPADRVREALRSPRYFHALHYPRGFSLHPLNYALGLAAAAEAAGARIFEDTPVIEIDPAGVRKRVITRHSRVRAAHVVLAGNVHLTELVPQFSSTLTPIFSTVIATAPLGGELHNAIRFPGAVSDSNVPGHHHRALEGGRLMWSGRSRAWLGKPQRHADALLRQLRRTYPQLGPVKAEYAPGLARSATPCTVHAADRRNLAGAVADERLRRAGAQHHGHGRRDRRAGDRQGRPRLAVVHAVRLGVGRRPAQPRGAASPKLVASLARALESNCARRRTPSAGGRRLQWRPPHRTSFPGAALPEIGFRGAGRRRTGRGRGQSAVLLPGVTYGSSGVAPQA